MTKRNRNRGRKGPSHKPSQRRSPERIRKKQASEAQARQTRRQFIRFGTAAAVMGAVGYGILRGEETPQSEPPKITASKPSVKPTIPDYEEWSSKIELPEIELSPQLSDWNLKERVAQFFPEWIDETKLKGAFDQIDEEIKEIFRKLDNERNIDIRHVLIQDYLVVLQKLHNELVDKEEDLNKPFYIVEHEIQKLLLLNNLYMEGPGYVQSGNSFIFYNVEKVHQLSIRFGEKERQFPVIYLKDPQPLMALPRRIDLPIGNYLKGLDAIVVNENYYKDRWKNRESFSYEMQSNIMHEGMHAALYMDLPEKARGKSSIKRRGDIDMGNYILKEDEYLQFSDRKGNQIQELAASGFGLANSGKSAKEIPGFSAGPEYGFARFMLQKELAHSHFVDPRLQLKLTSRRVTERDILNAVEQIPIEELHRIGERMAKLAIYLTQED